MNSRLTIRCIGTGDAFGSGGRLNSCFYVKSAAEHLLLDCGGSVLIGLQRCRINPSAIDTVVISHLHGDHFGGIAFLLLEAKYVSRRTKPLHLIGPTGLQQQVEAALEALFPGTLAAGFEFPLSYRQLDPTLPLQQGEFNITCRRVKHGSHPDVFALKLEACGKSICYSGDTEWTNTLPVLANETDLMIVECVAYDQPVPGHLDYQTLLTKRSLLSSRRLLLTHLGPGMLANLDRLEFEVANDGDLIEL